MDAPSKLASLYFISVYITIYIKQCNINSFFLKDAAVALMVPEVK